MSTALERLRDRMAELADLGNVGRLLEWDQQTMMPPRGASTRGSNRGFMPGLTHEGTVVTAAR